MSYALPFVKVTVEGHFGTSSTNIVEQWRAGFHLTKNGGVIGGTSELTAFLTALITPTITFHNTSALASGTTTWIDAVSAAYIGTDGKYALGSLQSTTRVPLGTPSAGVGTQFAPFSQAMVLSLRSLLTRGPASHGRIYWPATALTVTSGTGVISSATVTAIRTAALTYLNAINTLASSNFGSGTNVGLVSNKGSGFQSPVTRVGIGQKMDSMESRERDIPEAHIFGTLTISTLLLEELDREFRAAMGDAFPDSDLP